MPCGTLVGISDGPVLLLVSHSLLLQKCASRKRHGPTRLPRSLPRAAARVAAQNIVLLDGGKELQRYPDCEPSGRDWLERS